MKTYANIEGSIATIRIDGELDHHSAGKVLDDIEVLIGGKFPRELIVDMSAVSFMDSSGIAIVLGAYKRMLQVDGAVRLVNIPKQATKVLKAAGIDKILKIS